jgi:hypothetical protein
MHGRRQALPDTVSHQGAALIDTLLQTAPEARAGLQVMVAASDCGK